MAEEESKLEEKVDKLEKKLSKAEDKLDEELAKEEGLVLGDINDKNIVNTVVGTTIGFFVWFMWSKFIGTDPADMTPKREIVENTTLIIEPPKCAYDECNSDNSGGSEMVVITTQDTYDKNKSFW